MFNIWTFIAVFITIHNHIYIGSRDFWCDGESVFLQMSLNATVKSCAAAPLEVSVEHNKLKTYWVVKALQHICQSNNIFCVHYHIHNSQLKLYAAVAVCVCLFVLMHILPSQKLIAVVWIVLSLQRPPGNPEDCVWLGDRPGATQRPCPPWRERSQGWLWYQGSSPCSGAVQYTGLASSSSSVDKPILTIPRFNVSPRHPFLTPQISCTLLSWMLQVHVNQAYEAHSAPAARQFWPQVCNMPCQSWITAGWER